MKKILSLLLLVPMIAWAQDSNTEQKSQVMVTASPCDPVTKMFTTITDYQEGLLFTGAGMTFSPNRTPYQGGIMVFVNQDEGTFSIVQVFGDGTSCMLAIGTEFEPYSGPHPWE